MTPSGLAVTREGHIYLSDTGNHRLIRIERTNDGAPV
ncbi:MAG: hypothetical protein ACO1SX_10690 [Actinomycetota bacterium]